MKITGKTLMVNFETEVKLGNNDAIELTLVHQAYIFESKEGGIKMDLEFADTTDVKFLGIPIKPGYTEYKKFTAHLLELGIDLDMLIDEKYKEVLDDGIEDKLKLMFAGKF